MELHIAKEFSPYLYGRDDEDGEFNGVKFRQQLETKFSEALSREEPLVIVLNDIELISPSFIDEAFAKFVADRQKKDNLTITKKHLDFVSNKLHHDIYIDKIWQFIGRRLVPEQTA